MIYHWEQKKQKEKNDSAEISIFINADLLKELTRASEMEGLSRSLIIEKALKVYLKP
jgi:metal-responsive CopG/Arc/MetJ family transcriptional regulator